jgi:hypothetical protein
MPATRSLTEIRLTLQAYQKRLQFGDDLLSIKQLAACAGVHRDTIYSLLSGNRINHVSQIRLSRLVDSIKSQSFASSRLMHISMDHIGAKIGFGCAQIALFQRK